SPPRVRQPKLDTNHADLCAQADDSGWHLQAAERGARQPVVRKRGPPPRRPPRRPLPYPPIGMASAIARRWFDVDRVSAVAELTNSAVALAVQQIAKEKGKVTLFTGPATTRLTNEDCSPTGFHWAFDTYSQAVGTARAVVAEGGTPERGASPSHRSINAGTLQWVSTIAAGDALAVASGDLMSRNPNRGLLHARRERPRSRAANERDEVASPHSITSSARASSDGGTSRPSAFAAVRLIN